MRAEAPAMAPLMADVQVIESTEAPIVPSVSTGWRVQSVHSPVNLYKVGSEADFLAKNKKHEAPVAMSV